MSKTEQAIRDFAGKSNAGLRKMIRTALGSATPADILRIRQRVPLSPQGEAKLQAVWAAWQADNPVLGR